MQRKREKLIFKGIDPLSYYANKRAKRMPKKKTIEDFFDEANSVANPSHRLEVIRRILS